MNNWTTPKDVKNTLLKQWNKGLFLQPHYDQLFPHSIKLKSPTSKQLSEQFSDCQQWVKRIAEQSTFQIQWREINHQKLGKNRLPAAIVFDRLDDILNVINKTREYQQFNRLADELLTALPELYEWIIQYPFKALEHSNDWSALIQATVWIKDNPQPRIFIRQIRLKEIDTKLIENNKTLLTKWWDIVLPAQHINHTCTGNKQFEQRYGFKAKPPLVRFRILDPELYIQGLSDLTITATEFAKLKLNINTVFVTENDINGLTFPEHPKSIVIFGRGYGFEHLQQNDWLKQTDIFYWGDIDTHGFAILSQFRQYFPQTRSLLMDEETLLTQRKQWVQEHKQTQIDLKFLTPKEQRLYNKLRDNQIQNNLRLEQEFISYSLVTQKLISFL
ncbi:MAG: hypothetical protein KAU21_06905 [Gammaproteobacteria bacterium]|nr:hypothetical protein [Gammaproteobacteria bacterium]